MVLFTEGGVAVCIHDPQLVYNPRPYKVVLPAPMG